MSKPLTEQRLMNIALFYVSRYESSAEKVRQMLNRRLKRMKMQGEEVPPEASQWIEDILQKIQEKAYVDDNRYAENQVRTLILQGKSEHFICAKLALAGIEADKVREILSVEGSTEELRAQRFVARKRIGHFRPHADQSKFWEKDMAALARAGFSYDIARTALKGDEPQ